MFLQTRNAFEIDPSYDNNHIRKKIIGDFQQASNDSFFCAGNFPTYLSHLYIKEWRLTSWKIQTHKSKTHTTIQSSKLCYCSAFKVT